MQVSISAETADATHAEGFVQASGFQHLYGKAP